MNRISGNLRMGLIQARKSATAATVRRGPSLAKPNTLPSEGPRKHGTLTTAANPKESVLRPTTIRPLFIVALFILGLGAGYQVGRSNWQGISRNPPEDLGKTFE